MAKIDTTDRKVLFHLDRDSRLPYSKLGDLAGISQEAARYRVGRLVENGVINTFCTVVDAAKLGFAYIKVFLKLHNVTEKNIEEIIGYILSKPSICWLVRTDGSYDIGFAVKTANIHDILNLSNVLDDLTTVYDCFINKRVVCVNITGEYLTRDYLIHRSRKTESKGFYSVHSDPVPTDEINLRIIKMLALNSRYSAVDLAEDLPVASDAVLQRVKHLERQNIITRYNLVLNHYKLNQIHYKVFIYLNRINPEKQLAFINTCKTQPHITFVLKALAEWDLELDIEVEDIAQYRQVMLDLTSKYGEIINNYDALMISRIHKYNLFP